MKLSQMIKFGCVALCAVTLWPSASFADVTRRQCLNDAASARSSAIADAREAFNNAATACRGPCQEACVSSWKTCLADSRDTRESCVNDAEVVFQAAITECGTSVGCDGHACFRNRAFQTCLVESRVTRRTTVAACLRAARQTLRDADCKAELRSCNRSCNGSSSSSSSSSSESSESSESSSSSSDG